LYKLKRHVAARRAQLWWDYPPCHPVPNKHPYFTVLQIVESAFRMSIAHWTKVSKVKQAMLTSLMWFVVTALPEWGSKCLLTGII